MNRSITMRRVTAEDELFLYNLYKLSRLEEFAIAQLTEMQFENLMRMQYAARKMSYEGNYPESKHDIVVVDGVDAGQIWVNRDDAQLRVIDISIAGAFQNQGIGAALMRDLIAQAREAALPLRCSVATNNPGSLRFHQRLGFRITSADEMYYQMEFA
ncbi:MAG TPA: GNAT family N-acetyltransferase [Bryobacteraceae bacterium]|nr:GNAT family N-acetyltransferase [Bryobacteraceae bacterium]